jgi:hypothetical protein
MVYSFSREGSYIQTLDYHDMTGKDRTTPPTSPVPMQKNFECNKSIAPSIDHLVEKTETHVLVGLLLL